MYDTIIGVDLAKHLIQICVVTNGKVMSNNEITAQEFSAWLVNTKPSMIIFESCATSNYWQQVAMEAGHDARIISAKLVANIRQNQKTDKNDALAIVQASQLINIKFINGKTFSQQELQSILRMRELTVKHKVALQNQIEALLLEFNIRVSSRKGGLNGVVQSVLEDAENNFCMPFRDALNATWKLYLKTVENIKESGRLLSEVIKLHPECEKLLALEGVSIINAIHLYIAIGCGEAGLFQSGRDAAACIGLTPIQHSSGGKVKLGSIGRFVKNVSLRSYLVNGAMSVVYHVDKREAKTKKEKWLKELLSRKSKKCAAVALANKTVRTAYSMLTKGTEYKAIPL